MISLVFTRGFGGLIPLDGDTINEASTLSNAEVIWISIVMGVMGSPTLALILWPIVNLIKKIFLYGKGKKAKEITEQTQARIKNINNSIYQTLSELDTLQNKVETNSNNISHIKKLLPILSDYEKSLKLSENFSTENTNIDEIYRLMKSSVDRMSEECGGEFESVYKIMLEEFEKLQDSLISIEDGDTLAAISAMLMAEDYGFALQLLQKSVAKGSESGKEVIKIVLDQCEKNIYDSEYDLALEFLTPLKESGNQEAKELWRKAKDFQHQEQIKREKRIAEQKAIEDEEMMRRVRERLNSTPERTFTQGGPTGCGIGGSYCGCGSGR